MARPTKGDDNKRELMVYVRMTASEKSQLISNAAHAGLTPSDFIRSRTIGAQTSIKKATPDREPLIRGLAELGKIGSNVNQIARALNRKAGEIDNIDTDTLRVIRYSLDELLSCSKLLTSELKHGR